MSGIPKAVGELPYRVATRITFFVAGFLMASWAPLVAFAKARLELGDAGLGSLLLCVGIGSIISMPAAASLAHRIGLRKLIITSSLIFCLTLPGLAVSSQPAVMAFLLLVFGASLGILDISINFQAAVVERAAKMPLMSGFHGFFSVGTFAGASLGTSLLSAGITPLMVSLISALVGALLIGLARPRLITQFEDRPSDFFSWPRRIVIVLAALTFICLLLEGSMLDWSAVLLNTIQQVPLAAAGIGYSAFSLAMAAGRLSGDWACARYGDRRILQAGAAIGMIGFTLILTGQLKIALLGFALVGLGIANIVPVLFRAALNQRDVPGAQALSAVATVGYLGVLLGPGLIGLASNLTSLKSTFAGAALLLVAVLISSGIATRSDENHKR